MYPPPSPNDPGQQQPLYGAPPPENQPNPAPGAPQYPPPYGTPETPQSPSTPTPPPAYPNPSQPYAPYYPPPGAAPSQPYGPQPGMPGQPYGPQGSPSQPYWPQYPAQPYAPPPAPASGGVNPVAIVLPIVAVVLIAAIVGGVLLTRRSTVIVPGTAPYGSTTSTSFSPTATTATGPGSYAAQVPGEGCGNSGGWSAPQTGGATCGANGLNLTSPSSATSITEALFDGNGDTFSSAYAARVTVADLTNGCAGVGVLRDNYKGYAGYICSNDTWKVVRYDATGTPTTVDNGTYSSSGSDLIEMSVSTSTVSFTINSTSVSSDPIDSGYTTTTGIGLTLDHFSGEDATATDSDFVYSPA